MTQIQYHQIQRPPKQSGTHQLQQFTQIGNVNGATYGGNEPQKIIIGQQQQHNIQEMTLSQIQNQLTQRQPQPSGTHQLQQFTSGGNEQQHIIVEQQYRHEMAQVKIVGINPQAVWWWADCKDSEYLYSKTVPVIATLTPLTLTSGSGQNSLNSAYLAAAMWQNTRNQQQSNLEDTVQFQIR